MMVDNIKPILFHMYAQLKSRTHFLCGSKNYIFTCKIAFDSKLNWPVATSKRVHMRCLCEILFTSTLPRLCFVYSPRYVYVCFNLSSKWTCCLFISSIFCLYLSTQIHLFNSNIRDTQTFLPTNVYHKNNSCCYFFNAIHGLALDL